MPIRSLILFTLFGVYVHSAQALDVSTTTAPARLSDNAITIGERTLQLPQGEWTLVAEQKGSLDLDGLPNARMSTVFLALVKDQSVAAAMILTLPETSISTDMKLRWGGDGCDQATGHLYKETFDSHWRAPACLLIFNNRNYMGAQNEFMSKVRKWLNDEKLSASGPHYHISYSKNGDLDFGVIHIFIPEKSVAFSTDVGNWGDGLHPQLSRFFEKRDKKATLPEFPFKPE